MPHWYSHWWFVLGRAQPTQAATGWVGPLVSGSAFVTAWLVRRPRNALEPRPDYLAFIMGAVLLTGCFVVTGNYVYRWIFLVGTIPFLCRLDVARPPPALPNLQNATRLLIGLALWAQVPVAALLNLAGTIARWEDWTTGCLQLVTWSLFACLSGWLAHFVVTQVRITPEKAWWSPTSGRAETCPRTKPARRSGSTDEPRYQ